MFYLDCSVTDNSLAKRAGFAYDSKKQLWVTPFANIANKISSLGDSKVIESILHRRSQEEKISSESAAEWSNFVAPAPAGFKYKPFQLAGIASMVKKKHTLLADEMGLGKTIQFIGFCNVLRAKKVLIVCPASLKRNWKKELDTWLTYKPECLEIINYDILHNFHKALRAHEWDALALDEAHYIKNTKANRTKEVVGGRLIKEKRFLKPIEAKRKVCITGTPILNRPIELFTILKYLLPEGFPNQFDYAKRYCDAKRGSFGWDFKGASNLEELRYKLRSTIMIRRLKKDVLRDLDPKVRQIIEIDPSTKGLKALKREALQWKEQLGIDDVTNLTEQQYKDVARLMKSGKTVGIDEWATARHDAAIEKIPLVIQHIRDAIDASGKVIVFCHHRDVVAALENAFASECVAVVGGMSGQAKEAAKDRFQNDDEVTIFIGNLQAAGVGLTLTASSHVIFVEFSPVPGEVKQAEDRAHRIGQLDSVLVQYLVLSGSLDATLIKMIVKKLEVNKKALDGDEDFELEAMLA